MKIVITQNVSLDGRAEMLDDWFDPSGQDGDLADELARQSAEEEILLVGRKTFTDLRGYWPHQHDDTTGVAGHLDRVDKRVVTSTLTDLGWENSSVVEGDPRDAVRRWRDRPGGDVVVTGSLGVAHALIEARLVDEFRMFVHPAWQGRGRGFFPEGYSTAGLDLLRTRVFDNGVVHLAYAAEPRR